MTNNPSEGSKVEARAVEVEFSWKMLFSEVLVSRNGIEIEERLSWGFPGRVPPLESVVAEMPRPWLFARCLLFSLLGSVILWYTLAKTENVNLVPAFMLFGCFAMPCSVMVLFYETNIFKDVSFIRTIGGFLVGAVMSLCLAMPLYWLAGKLGFSLEQAWVAGPVEETAKLIAALFLLRFTRHKTVFCGLLVGSAVGAGFAAFESAGYALNAAFDGQIAGLMGQMSDLTHYGYSERSAVDPIISQVTGIVVVRGVMSPFAHVAWTALSTAAICRATGGRPLTWAACKDPRFYGMFILVIVLHMVWNSPLGRTLDWWIKPGILGLIAWTSLAAMLKNGLRQARSMKIALAVGDTSVMAAMGRMPRTSKEQDLWYQRGSDVHGPLKLHQLAEMVESAVLPRAALVSDGSQWRPFEWWMGEDTSGHPDGGKLRSDLWAWGLVWWPVIVAGVALLLRNPWALAAFPILLVGMALIDRAANRVTLQKKWPTSIAAVIPPLYLSLRRKLLKESPLKLILGTVVTTGILTLAGFSLWSVYGTDEGRVLVMVNTQLTKKGYSAECVEVTMIRTVTPGIKVLRARYSNGESSNVTLIRKGGEAKVEIESMP